MTIKDEKNPPRQSFGQNQAAGPSAGGLNNANGLHVSVTSGGFHITG
jgi:hypothetical protein